jgi:limonene-1,2-epoxide hydrolase
VAPVAAVVREPTRTNSGGRGFGTGFGLRVTPIGVYEVRDGAIVWRPTVDVNRLLKGGQVLAGIIAVCITLGRWSRR